MPEPHSPEAAHYAFKFFSDKRMNEWRMVAAAFDAGREYERAQQKTSESAKQPTLPWGGYGPLIGDVPPYGGMGGSINIPATTTATGVVYAKPISDLTPEQYRESGVGTDKISQWDTVASQIPAGFPAKSSGQIQIDLEDRSEEEIRDLARQALNFKGGIRRDVL